MTPPVLLEGLSGAAPIEAGVGKTPAHDPELAAEFTALLGAAMPEATPPEAGLVSVPDCILTTGAGLPSSPRALSGAATTSKTTELGITEPGTIGCEGETETAGSADPKEILDSTSDASKLAELLEGAVVNGPKGPPLPNGATGRTTKGCPTPGDGSVRGIKGKRSESGESAAKIGKADGTGEKATAFEGLLSDVTLIQGGSAGGDDLSGDGARQEGSEDAGGTPEISLGAATNLITDRSEGFDVTRTGRLEARDLDRGERTKIVHQVIDRISNHVENLAISRSKDPLTIHLEPADLGRIVVEISRETSGLVAEMQATDPRVAEALDRHRGELAAGLAAKGHTEARITVTAASTAQNPTFDLRRDGGQNPQQQPASGRPAPAFSPPTGLNAVTSRPRPRVRVNGLDLQI